MVMKTLRPLPLLLLALVVAGCDGPDADSPASAQTEVRIPEMGALRLLSRASIDLRGVRPSAEEIARVQADPTVLDAVVAEYLEDARFGARIRSLYGEIYLTEADYFMVSAAQFGIGDEPAFLESVGQEPLRILERVAQEDRPWTDIVTVDWTMANETLAEMFPLDYPAGGDGGWAEARYTDGRPAAGVLSTTGLWLRYTSTDSNANRKRANTVSRILLCNDYLTRPIEFDREVDLLDDDAVNAALTTNPACVNCHASLDPLSAYFFGFWSYLEDSWVDVSRYHPERELLYDAYLGTSPVYYGEAGDSLADLGQQIAADPRFVECAVEQVYGQLLQREITLADMPMLTAHREAFLAGGLTMRALVASVVADPRYRAARATTDETARPTKMLSPDLLASVVEDLTGFRWEYVGYDMLRSDRVGVRTLAGGADGNTVTRNTTTPNTTITLVQERLAEAAAVYVVSQDGALEPAERRLLTALTDLDATPETDREQLVTQIQHLHTRLLGQEIAADGEEIEANLALWSELYAISGETGWAWAGLISALLRDPDFLLY